jgi:hypothetical protein
MSTYPVPIRRDSVQPTNIVVAAIIAEGQEIGTVILQNVIRMPSFKVFAGQTVRLRAYNGTPEGNTGNIRACSTGAPRDLLGNFNCEQIPPGVEVPFPVNDTGMILITGENVGDGVQVTIKG